MKHNKKYLLIVLTVSFIVNALFISAAYCDTNRNKGSVYFFNFKPEADAAWQEVAKLYKERTGVDVKVVTKTNAYYLDELRDRYGIKVYVSEEESKFMQNYNNNLSVFFGEGMIVKPDISIRDGEELEIAGIKMKFILTPGHTPGSGCFYVEDEGV
ncbi:MAG: MBL fold metallo-hydrolase, partial [Candidatus Riflebacteria bacterium]|nr:MBL fold metallo-hydrolase [Candidatus Riflebacteria bacterium]